MSNLPPQVEKEFQEWWNEHIFDRDPPREKVYKRLFAQGVSLDYVHFLCDALRFWDWWAKMIRERAAPSQKPPTLLDAIKPHQRELGSLVRLLCNVTVFMVLEEIKRILPEFSASLNLSHEERQKLVDKSLAVYVALGVRLSEKRLEISRAESEEMQARKKNLIAEFPLFAVLDKYNQPMPRKRGNQPDRWGTFILLALSEHIREKTGHPGYSEAIGLLRLSRKLLGKVSRQLAETRIREFKRSNPSWQADLGSLKMQFSLSQNTPKPSN